MIKLFVGFVAFFIVIMSGLKSQAVPIVPGFVPIADAGVDQNAEEGNVVAFDGLNSFSFDLSTMTFSWSQVSGPEVTLTGANTAIPYFTAPEVGAEGATLVFQLVVSDGSIESDPDYVVVQVLDANKDPIANAGPGQSVLQGTTVVLDGTASSDPDGNPITYSWFQGPSTVPITLQAANTAHPFFIVPNVGVNGGTIRVGLTVSDSMTTSSPAFVTIIVNSANHAPLANAGADVRVAERSIVNLNGAGSSDPELDPLTYRWTQVSGTPVTLSNSSSSSPSFTAPEIAGSDQTLTFSLIVNDRVLDSAASLVNVQIFDVNRAPISNPGGNLTVNERSLVNLDGSASNDPDGDAIFYFWTQISGPAVELSLYDVPNPNFIAPDVSLGGATIGFTLTVSDGLSTTVSQPIFINVLNVNRAPIADAGMDQTVNMQTFVTLNGTDSQDLDGDNISYVWSQISGPVVTLNTSNPLHPTFTAPRVALDGAIATFSLIVSDGFLQSEPAIVNVAIKNVNHAPVANAGPAQSVSAETIVAMSAIDSYDPDDDAISFTWTQVSGPSVVLTDANTDNPTFLAPNVTAAGAVLTFNVNVSDGKLSSNATVAITVQRVNHAPIAKAGLPQTILEKTIATLDGSESTDPDGDTLSYSWTLVSGPQPVMDFTDPVHPRLIAPDIGVVTQLKFSLVVSDGFLSSAPSTVVITIKPVIAPPSCHLGRVHDPVLWPPNHKMEEIEVEEIFEKDHDHDVGNKITFTSVTQDEPTNGLGDGDTPVDAVVKARSVFIRKERHGNGDGRVYTLNYTAVNRRGETCVGTVKLCCPKDAKQKSCKEGTNKHDSRR